jgi:hypothetical protein
MATITKETYELRTRSGDPFTDLVDEWMNFGEGIPRSRDAQLLQGIHDALADVKVRVPRKHGRTGQMGASMSGSGK